MSYAVGSFASTHEGSELTPDIKAAIAEVEALCGEHNASELISAGITFTQAMMNAAIVHAVMAGKLDRGDAHGSAINGDLEILTVMRSAIDFIKTSVENGSITDRVKEGKRWISHQ